MSFFGNLFKSEFEKWVEGASHEELSDAYEEERQKWIREVDMFIPNSENTVESVVLLTKVQK